MTEDQKAQRGGARPGAGRPPMYDRDPTTTVSFVCPVSLKDRVDEASKEQGLSRSQYIVAALKAIAWEDPEEGEREQ